MVACLFGWLDFCSFFFSFFAFMNMLVFLFPNVGSANLKWRLNSCLHFFCYLLYYSSRCPAISFFALLIIYVPYAHSIYASLFGKKFYVMPNDSACIICHSSTAAWNYIFQVVESREPRRRGYAVSARVREKCSVGAV